MRHLSQGLAVALLTLSIAAPSLAQPGGGDDLDALLSEEARTATELARNEQSRQEIELQGRQFEQRGQALDRDFVLNFNEIQRFNTTCAGTLEGGTLQRCQSWRGGLASQQAVLLENADRLNRDIQAVRGRDQTRVGEARTALNSLASLAVRIDMVCARTPAAQRPARCRRINFDPRIRDMMARLHALASQHAQSCLAAGRTNEAIADCARVPFDTSSFTLARAVETVPGGYRVTRQ